MIGAWEFYLNRISPSSTISDHEDRRRERSSVMGQSAESNPHSFGIFAAFCTQPLGKFCSRAQGLRPSSRMGCTPFEVAMKRNMLPGRQRRKPIREEASGGISLNFTGCPNAFDIAAAISLGQMFAADTNALTDHLRDLLEYSIRDRADVAAATPDIFAFHRQREGERPSGPSSALTRWFSQ